MVSGYSGFSRMGVAHGSFPNHQVMFQGWIRDPCGPVDRFRSGSIAY